MNRETATEKFKTKQKKRMPELMKAIKAFLQEPRLSDGGYAPVTKDDMAKLVEVLVILREMKCERDPDGDIPIEVDLTNRCTHERTHFRPVPYSHEPGPNGGEYTDKAMWDNYEMAEFNLGIAMESFSRISRCVRASRRDKEQKK